MKRVIGWLFLLLSPFMLGAILEIMLLNYLEVSHDHYGVLVSSYVFSWVFLFATWFDGSKYQNSL